MHNQLTEVAAFYRSRATADLALADKLEADAKAFNGEVEPVTAIQSEPFTIPADRSIPPFPEVKRRGVRPLAPALAASREIVSESMISRPPVMPTEVVQRVKEVLGAKAHGRIGPIAKHLGVSRAELEAVLTPANGFLVLSKGWFKQV